MIKVENPYINQFVTYPAEERAFDEGAAAQLKKVVEYFTIHFGEPSGSVYIPANQWATLKKELGG